jgi:hypothetical protein
MGMTTSKLRISILGAALALAAVVTTPALAGPRVVHAERTTDSAAVELARGVVGQRDVYAPTGETIDLTLNVVASRDAD